MRIEEMLTDALREEAEAREVDVPRLWSQTSGRLEEQERSDRRTTGRRRLAVLAGAAAAVVAVTAGGVALSRIDAGREPGPAAPGGSQGPVEGGVDDAFSCPQQITLDRPLAARDGHGSLANLEDGAKVQAAAHDAPRYEVEEHGDRASLRFGNADGTLATLSKLHWVDGGWVGYRTDVCVGEDGSMAVPLGNEFMLDNHTDRPYPAAELTAEDLFFIDGRYYYDRLGLVRYRRIVGGACGRRLCLTADDLGRWSTTLRLPPGSVPHDVSQLFLPTDEMPGRHNPYGLWALYDRADTVASVKAFRLDRNSSGIVSMSSDSWPGQLHLLLEPFHEVDRIEVRLRRGAVAPGDSRTRIYTVEELPWYDARVHR